MNAYIIPVENKIFVCEDVVRQGSERYLMMRLLGSFCVSCSEDECSLV